MKNHKIKYFIFILLFTLLSLNLIFENFSIYQLKFKELKGYSTVYYKPVFSVQNWLSGKYQDSLNLYLDNNIFFHIPLVKLNSQYLFSFFRKSNAPELVIGKNDECYQIDYIREFTGEYYVGEDLLKRRFQNLKYLQDTLDKLGIKLMIVLAPGKCRYKPDNIPEHLLKNMSDKDITNYTSIVNLCKKLQINCLDLQNYFEEIKDTCSFPLFPTYGVHWSDYGMTLALDTFLNYAKNLTQKNIPKLKIKKLELTNIPRGPDYDMGEIMNLIFRLPEKTLAYPVFDLSDTVNSIKDLNVLFVGDSFLPYWLKYDLPNYLYKTYNFWSYNSMVYPEFYTREVYTDQLNLKEEILKRNLIVLECSERFLYTAFWKFEERIFYIFNEAAKTDGKLLHYNSITGKKREFSLYFEYSKKIGKPFYEVIDSVASNYDKIYAPGTVEYYKYMIKLDEKWFEAVKKDAIEKNVPLEEMIQRHAEWMVMQYEKNLNN